jgi:N-acetylglutamate synthase-like GNAT family acetyltransferase
MTTAHRESQSPASAVTIRAATPDDVPALVALVNAAYRVSEGHVFPGSSRLERTEAMEQLDRIAIAELDGKLAACVDIDLTGDAAHFGLLATDMAMQRRGVASMLIEHAEEQARAAGHATMRIEVVKQGGRIPYYERRGYRVTGETPGQVWNGGQDWGAAIEWHMVDMEKQL